jgi:hypothetical protein
MLAHKHAVINCSALPHGIFFSTALSCVENRSALLSAGRHCWMCRPTRFGHDFVVANAGLAVVATMAADGGSVPMLAPAMVLLGAPSRLNLHCTHQCQSRITFTVAAVPAEDYVSQRRCSAEAYRAILATEQIRYAINHISLTTPPPDHSSP